MPGVCFRAFASFLEKKKILPLYLDFYSLPGRLARCARSVGGREVSGLTALAVSDSGSEDVCQ